MQFSLIQRLYTVDTITEARRIQGTHEVANARPCISLCVADLEKYDAAQAEWEGRQDGRASRRSED